tara:strand:+ start:1714 stop:2634 length:921 start_codon:yes stop_codon:yes gene_type:complete
MKVVFFSESQIKGDIPRNFPNARTEYAWMMALDAPHYNINEIPLTDQKFDLGIVIIPKNNPNVDLESFKVCCDKVAVMQEGPHWYFQDYTIDKQFYFYNTLLSADWVYCHNESDVKYYKGLGCKDVRVMGSLMITDGLLPRSKWGDGTIIGGNFVSWYGGFDSYIVAREIGNPIWAPSMGRKQDQEDMIEDIKYMPYMSWREWITTLSQFNIGIHLMRTHAAGTFAMNCGFNGIPCIGYKGLDTQQIIHPNTTIEVGDLKSAKEIALKLKNDEEFYRGCSEETQYRFNEFYTEEKWLENWEKQWIK